jgi:hypothetical protein
VTPAARTSFAFGIYVVAVGVVILLAPNLLLSIFTLPTTSEVWIRVAGAIAVPLGFYYIEAARAEATFYFRVSVWGRVFFALSLAAFVAVGLSRWPLLLFGLIDLAGAGWTAFELRHAGVSLRPASRVRA